MGGPGSGPRKGGGKKYVSKGVWGKRDVTTSRKASAGRIITKTNTKETFRKFKQGHTMITSKTLLRNSKGRPLSEPKTITWKKYVGRKNSRR